MERYVFIVSRMIPDGDEPDDEVYVKASDAAALVAERDRLADLLYGARCIYCGEVVGKEHKNQEISDLFLREHVEQCEKHPAFKFKQSRDEALEVLDEIVGEWFNPQSGIILATIMSRARALLKRHGRI